jgi:hypothetical protein
MDDSNSGDGLLPGFQAKKPLTHSASALTAIKYEGVKAKL